MYLLYWNFLPRLGKLLNTRSTERTCTRRRPPNAGSGAVTGFSTWNLIRPAICMHAEISSLRTLRSGHGSDIDDAKIP